MSTELAMSSGFKLPDTFEEFQQNKAAVMAATGQGEVNQIGLPLLRVNYDAEWASEDDPDDVVQLVRGVYKMTFNPDGGSSRVTVYAKTAKLQPLFSGFRYSVYDNDEKKYTLETSIFRGWGDTLFDSQGREARASGKKVGYKDKYKADPIISKLKCQNICMGLVTLVDAKDMNGESHKVVNMPVMYTPQGANFMPYREKIDSLTKENKLMHEHSFTMKTRREKNDGVTYFVSEYELDKKQIPLDKTTFDHMREFNDIINGINTSVKDKFDKVKDDPSAASIVEGVTKSDKAMDAEFDDEIPY